MKGIKLNIVLSFAITLLTFFGLLASYPDYIEVTNLIWGIGSCGALFLIINACIAFYKEIED